MIYYWYLKAAEILSPLYNDSRAPGFKPCDLDAASRTGRPQMPSLNPWLNWSLRAVTFADIHAVGLKL